MELVRAIRDLGKCFPSDSRLQVLRQPELFTPQEPVFSSQSATQSRAQRWPSHWQQILRAPLR